MDRRMIGTKNPGRCGEVAAIERWLLVEARLYLKTKSNHNDIMITLLSLILFLMAHL